MTNKLARGFKLRLHNMTFDQLCDLANLLDTDPEKLPHADHTKPSELNRRMRGAIMRQLMVEGNREIALKKNNGGTRES